MKFYADDYFHWGYDGGRFNRSVDENSVLSMTFTSPTRDVMSFGDEMINACEILKDNLGGDQVTLSLSGGSDSQVALYCMKQVGIDVQPVHARVSIGGTQINAPETSQALLVCEKHGFDLHIVDVDLGSRINFYTEIVNGSRFVHFYRFINLDVALAVKDRLNIAVSGDVIYEALLDSSEDFSNSDFRVYDDLRLYSDELGLNMFNSFYKIDPHLYYSLMCNPLFFEFNQMFELFKAGADKFLDVNKSSSDLDKRYFYGNFIKYFMMNRDFKDVIVVNNKLFPHETGGHLYTAVKEQWLSEAQWNQYNTELNVPFSEIIDLSNQRNAQLVKQF